MKLWIIFIGYFIIISCSDNLDIKQDYDYTLETLPVPSVIQKNETVEIRCKIVREIKFDGAKYFLRYFQPDGKGILKLNGITLSPNDLYPLSSDVFRLYYISKSTNQQKIDIYIEDSFGKIVQKSFSFTTYSEQNTE